MLAAKVFADTNTLIYSHDQRFPAKRDRANQWLDRLVETNGVHVNLQVLNELCAVLLRKKWFDTPATVYAIVEDFAEFGDAPIGWAEIDIARTLHQRYGYSWWDCLLLASALELGCTHYLSEDLQDGQRIEANGRSLTIVDPFAHSPERLLA